VDEEDGMAWVGDGGVEGVEESKPIGDLAEEQHPGVGGQPTALEVGDDGFTWQGGKVEGSGVTVCHSGGLARETVGSCVNPYLITSKAIALFLIHCRE
jgi:hypothetical protein